MSRLTRFSPAHHCQHVQQRGHNGEAVFLCEQDYAQFVAWLHDYARQFGLAVHAYAVLPQQFQLLLTPQTDEGLPLFMQALGRRYGRYFNQTQGRSGALWDGRYKATLIEAERHLLSAMVHVARAPVRAGLCVEALGHRWSSHAHYAGQRVDAGVQPHALYWRLGNTPFAREAAYTALVNADLSEATERALSQAFASAWPLGSDAFLAELQKLTPRRLSRGRAGRPVRAVRGG
jgi:putative transposase